jgi:hypothetical protein
MGLLSILEFKHDYTDWIDRYPDLFTNLLLRFLETGETANDTPWMHTLEDFGVTVRHTRHNSLPDPIEGTD